MEKQHQEKRKSQTTEKPEKYTNGPIDIFFDHMPRVQLVSISVQREKRWLYKLKAATSRREFSLVADWELKLNRVNYKPELNGTIVIPKIENGQQVVFDGASVPAPWLTSFISGGLLRPLGLMLIASIVHDFAFKYGFVYLRDASNGSVNKVSVERHEADLLFRDIIHSISEMPVFADIAWVAVRMGWVLFVKYNGKARGGEPPIKAASIVVSILLLAPVVLAAFFGAVAVKWYFGLWFSLLLIFYAAIFYAKRLD